MKNVLIHFNNKINYYLIHKNLLLKHCSAQFRMKNVLIHFNNKINYHLIHKNLSLKHH
jgi:hypothetical protein